MDQMDQANVETRRGASLWLNAIIAVALLALGGWLVYDFLLKPAAPLTDEVVLEPPARPRVGPAPVRVAPPRPVTPAPNTYGDVAEGVALRYGGAVYARRGPGYVAVSRTPEKVNVVFDYVNSVRTSWVSPAAHQLHILAQRIVDTPNLGKEVNLTDAQRQKLTAISPAVQLDEAERSQLAALALAWSKAAPTEKKAAAEALLAAVARIGQAHLAQTKTAMEQRVVLIPSILTPEQLQQARQWVLGTPATTRPAAPATKPAKP